MALTCCEAHGNCRQGRDCPHRVERDIAELALDRIAYLSAYAGWFCSAVRSLRWEYATHFSAKQYARSEQINARRARAERAGMRGVQL